MSGIADIIVYGFGSWSTVTKLPVLGFGLVAAVALPASGYEAAAPKERMHARARGRCHSKAEGRLHARVREESYG